VDTINLADAKARLSELVDRVRPATLSISYVTAADCPYSHSIVPDGLLGMSDTTRTPLPR
jgi:hypothetical protein